MFEKGDIISSVAGLEYVDTCHRGAVFTSKTIQGLSNEQIAEKIRIVCRNSAADLIRSKLSMERGARIGSIYMEGVYEVNSEQGEEVIEYYFRFDVFVVVGNES